MKNVLMIVMNNVIYDARVKKEALTLKENNYNIKIFGLKEFTNDSIDTDYHGIPIILIELIAKKLLPKNNFGWICKYLEYVSLLIIKSIKLDIDVIHAHNLECLVPAYLISKLKKTKIVYDSHELSTEMSGKKDGFINKLWRIVEKKLLKSADRVIAANKSRAEIMFNEYGAPALPTAILNIPERKDKTKSSDNSLYDFLRQRDIADKKIVLYQGRISPYRSLDKLILSVKYWENDLVLILLGPIYRDRLQKDLDGVILDNKLSERVFFHPPVANESLTGFTNGASIGIVIYDKSSRNNFYCAPNKLFEYINSGLPIAGCDFPEVRKVLNKYRIGELFDPDNPESIANAVNRVAKTPDNYNNQDLFEKVMTEYSWKSQQDKLIELYQDLIQGK